MTESDPTLQTPETRQWAMFLHLSQFAGVLIPLAGFVAPLIIWQVKKDELPGIEPHGRTVMNWIITELVYGIAFGLLCFILIGFPLLFALAIAGVAFPIIGAIQASDGKLWNYPTNIRWLG